VKTNEFLPGQLLIRHCAYFSKAPNDSTIKDRHGAVFFQVVQKANAKRHLARPTRTAQQTDKGKLEL
jgi:hypothetical protein